MRSSPLGEKPEQVALSICQAAGRRGLPAPPPLVDWGCRVMDLGLVAIVGGVDAKVVRETGAFDFVLVVSAMTLSHGLRLSSHDARGRGHTDHVSIEDDASLCVRLFRRVLPGLWVH